MKFTLMEDHIDGRITLMEDHVDGGITLMEDHVDGRNLPFWSRGFPALRENTENTENTWSSERSAPGQGVALPWQAAGGNKLAIVLRLSPGMRFQTLIQIRVMRLMRLTSYFV